MDDDDGFDDVEGRDEEPCPHCEGEGYGVVRGHREDGEDWEGECPFCHGSGLRKDCWIE